MGKVIFKNVSFRYGERDIFKDFSLEVEPGQILCLVGPSGCGKTTLARCLLGLNKPRTGEIYVGDECLFSAEKRINVPVERRNIGIVFQDYAVWPHMTVKENVLYPLRKRRVPRDEAEKRAMRALSQVNMTEYAAHLPSQLSGGQQQRVAIARALVCDGGLIVMDEPITNLDAKLREQMLLEIREIQRNLGTTILYITHDQQSALQLCDKMAVMQQDGSLCQVGTDEDIILRPANRFAFEFIGVSNFIPVVALGGGLGLDTGAGVAPWDGTLPAELDLSHGVELGVRPNDIVFDQKSPLRARVERCTFLGSEYDYRVTLGARELRVQQNTLDAVQHGVAKAGDEVGLLLLNPRYYEAKKEASA
ncbi:MAG: ABC transporter ATP-binding protein [Pyramidobacter sp.]|uniref:ABC transporter ATP-binding protein n=1 Tax=Pyramidobacter sp. TaxID=1943581 RepID=UPI002A83D167|nr:ABC transporter ATP-binding protein [Pyramidobacter sp.]MDY4033170.1 ABC transporter ATP-binding protein [Pyramidobacter sp.]